jgi:hypothetical protein
MLMKGPRLASAEFAAPSFKGKFLFGFSAMTFFF